MCAGLIGSAWHEGAEGKGAPARGVRWILGAVGEEDERGGLVHRAFLARLEPQE